MTTNHRLILLDAIMLIMGFETFSYTTSARIVGGRRKLERLIADGKIDAHKGKNVKNSKWRCNAAHVLLNCRMVKLSNR